MRKKVSQICSILAVSLIVLMIFIVSASAEETGKCVVANRDYTIIYQNRSFSDAARLTYGTTNYWVDLWSDVTTDGVTFTANNLSIQLNTYKLTGNFTITNGVNLYQYNKSSPGVYGTIYVTGGPVTVEEGLYVQDWELSGGSVNFEPAAEDLADGYEAVDNGDGTWSIQPKSETQDTIDIVVNNTGESSGVLVTAPSSGWLEGTNTFAVSCGAPCAVAISYDGGATYTRLAATADTDGYLFTAENMTADTVLAVTVLGDANGDGSFTNADITQIRAAYAGKVALNPIQLQACDVNGDGSFTNADVTLIRAVYAAKSVLAW